MSIFNLFGGKTSSPSPTYLQTQKSKQIESLRKIPATVSETIRDVEYRVTFPVNGVNYSLVVSLPPKFPQDQPMVKVEPCINHPWVDNQMRVTHCPALLNFSMHSSLGTAVQSIVEEFQRNPPQLQQQHSFGNPAGQIPYPASGYSQGYPTSSINPYTADMPTPVPFARTPSLSSYTSQMSAEESIAEDSRKSSYKMPDVPNKFPSFKDWSISELNELMNDEGKMLEVLQQQPQLEKISEDRKALSKNCEDLAKSNLSRKPEVESLKSAIIEKWDYMNELKNLLESNISRMSLISEQFHPNIIQTNLKVAASEAEEESERIAEDFLDKKIDVDTFKQKFMEIRTLCHTRRAKEEKLQQLLLSQGHHY